MSSNNNKTLRILFWTTSAFYLALSTWRIVFQGLLEKPSSKHLEAGAGDWGLLIQLFMAGATVVMALAWLFLGSGKRESRAAVVLIILAPVLFCLAARGLQRYAPGYTEKGFELLQAEFEKRPLKGIDVQTELGDPLVTGAFAFDRRYWVYSYMPSCGFGWDKKYVFFDETDRVTSICTISEP